MKSLAMEYEDSIICLVYPGENMTGLGITNLLQEVGRHRSKGMRFMRSMRSDEGNFLVYGHCILSASNGIEYTELGLVYAFSLQNGYAMRAATICEQYEGSAGRSRNHRRECTDSCG